MSPGFSLSPHGGISVDLGEGEVEFLRQLVSLLSEVGGDDGDPAAERLDVTPYLDDPDASDEYRRLMAPELDQARIADRSAFVELLALTGTGVEMSPAEAEAALRVLVEGRLVLAARMKVEVEEDYQRLDPESASALAYLGHLQLELMRCIGP